ncbi:MAG: hypothetical protein FWF88_08655 [Peptococcaceae bacterium]|nr:hypothetical protein [Peptococcaceae bacterium]
MRSANGRTERRRSVAAAFRSDVSPPTAVKPAEAIHCSVVGPPGVLVACRFVAANISSGQTLRCVDGSRTAN